MQYTKRGNGDQQLLLTYNGSTSYARVYGGGRLRLIVNILTFQRVDLLGKSFRYQVEAE